MIWICLVAPAYAVLVSALAAIRALEAGAWGALAMHLACGLLCAAHLWLFLAQEEESGQ
jgi:hypothetical protein